MIHVEVFIHSNDVSCCKLNGPLCYSICSSPNILAELFLTFLSFINLIQPNLSPAPASTVQIITYQNCPDCHRCKKRCHLHKSMKIGSGVKPSRVKPGSACIKCKKKKKKCPGSNVCEKWNRLSDLNSAFLDSEEHFVKTPSEHPSLQKTIFTENMIRPQQVLSFEPQVAITQRS